MRLFQRLMETSAEGGDPGAGGTDDQGPSDAEIETQAREAGWKPKEEWRGDTSRWIDAKTYLDRGQNVLPYVQASRQQAKRENEQLRQENARLQQQLSEVQNTQKELLDFQKDMAKDRQERRKSEIQTELTAARQAGDDVRVAELQNELGEVVREPAKPVTKPAQTQPAIQPWLKTFIDGNQDFFQDPIKIGAFNGVVETLRRKGDQRGLNGSDGTALMSEAMEQVNKLMNPQQRRQQPRSEETRSTGGSRRPATGGQLYADLPDEAKTKCDAQASKFVGKLRSPNDPTKKMSKDEFRDFFAKEYFDPSTFQSNVREM